LTWRFTTAVNSGLSASGSATFGTGSDDIIQVALGDVDGDGHLDIVVGNASQRGRVYLNDGSGGEHQGKFFFRFQHSGTDLCRVSL
jgi:hypothetical protein